MIEFEKSCFSKSLEIHLFEYKLYAFLLYELSIRKLRRIYMSGIQYALTIGLLSPKTGWLNDVKLVF